MATEEQYVKFQQDMFDKVAAHGQQLGAQISADSRGLYPTHPLKAAYQEQSARVYANVRGLMGIDT